MPRLSRTLAVVSLVGLAGPAPADPPPKADDLKAEYLAKPQWANRAFEPQAGTFTAEFDVTLSHDKVRAAVALSDGPTSGKSNGPVFVVFEEKANVVYVRKTGGKVDPVTKKASNYVADNEVRYAAGKPLRLRVVADVKKKTFSVYATPPGGKEAAVVVDSPFEKVEKTPDGVARLNNIAVSLVNDKPLPEGATITVSKLTVR